MGKVLMAMDEGSITKYVGKTIDELDDNVDDNERGSDIEIGLGESKETHEPEEVQVNSPQNNPSMEIEFPKQKNLKRKLFLSDDEEDMNEEQKRGDTPGRKRAFARRKVHKKRTMTERLREALRNEFSEELKNMKKCPSTTRVLQAIASIEKEFPEILEHSPKKIKSLVSNWNRQLTRE